MGCEESPEGEVGSGINEEVEMDVWCYTDGQDTERKN